MKKFINSYGPLIVLGLAAGFAILAFASADWRYLAPAAFFGWLIVRWWRAL
jgi:hypothetical protein